MTLSALMKKGGLAELATMTPATIATQETDYPVTVAAVATVAVALTPGLSTDEKTRIRSWLAHIKEVNPDTISHVLNKCRTDSKVCRYVLNRSGEIPQLRKLYPTN